MFTKAHLIRNDVPSFVAFIILYFLGDRCVLPPIFINTDGGNLNLLILLAVDAAVFLPTF